MRSVRGYVPYQMARSDFKVYGMKDTTAAQAAYDALGALDGVQQVHLDIAHRRAIVMHDQRPGLVDEMVQTLRDLGLRAVQKG
ncbi:MAG: heavy-metal-associated domain-containing protein [Bacillota bacterium]